VLHLELFYSASDFFGTSHEQRYAHERRELTLQVLLYLLGCASHTGCAEQAV
jgi:hypothetical protein